MEQEFHRIKRLPPYVFAEVNELKARARAAGEDIIDFGMGNPDQPPPAHVVEKMVEALRDPRIHRYSTSRGIPGLRRANAAYYGRRYLGSIAGILQMARGLALGSGPLVAGIIYDLNGSYAPAFTAFSVMCVGAVVMMAFVRRPTRG